MRFFVLWFLMFSLLAQAAPTLITRPVIQDDPHELYPRSDPPLGGVTYPSSTNTPISTTTSDGRPADVPGMGEREGSGTTSTTLANAETGKKSFFEKHQKLIEGGLIGIAGTGIAVGLWDHFGRRVPKEVALA